MTALLPNRLALAAALKQRGIPVVFARANCPEALGRDVALGCPHKLIPDNSLAGALAAAEAVLALRQPPTLPSAMHLYTDH